MRTADLVFKPRGLAFRAEDLGLSGLESWRDKLGAIILLAVAAWYGGLPAVAQHYGDVIAAIGVEVLLLMALTAAVGGWLLAQTPVERRGAELPRLALPLATASTLMATSGVMVLLANIVSRGMTAILVVYPGFWVLIFFFRGTYLAVTGMCRAADAHPLFAPILRPAFAWALAVVTAIGLVGGGSPDGTPGLLAFAVEWGGPATLTVLSVLEVRALRKRGRGSS